MKPKQNIKPRTNKNAPPIKSTLFNTILPQLKQQSSYFSIQAVRRVVSEHKLKTNNALLVEYMSEAMAKGIVYDAGRGWYTRHKEPVTLDLKPVKKIIRSVKKLFPLLNFCCWSTLQLNPFAKHLIAQPTTFLYTESDNLEPVAERLRDEGWDAWANPKKVDIERYVKPGEKTVVLRSSISRQPKAQNHVAPVEKVMADLLAETPLLNLMDIGEANEIIDNILKAGAIQIPIFINYMSRRGIELNEILSTHFNQIGNNIGRSGLK